MDARSGQDAAGPRDAGMDGASNDGGLDASDSGDAGRDARGPNDGGSDAGTPATLLVEVREFRLDGPGPGVPDRTIIRYETPYLNPLEKVTTDADGWAHVSGPGPFDVVVESPTGRTFYALSQLPTGEAGTDGHMIVAHPDFPPASDRVTVDVQLDADGFEYDSALLQAGNERTRQRFSISEPTSDATIELQQRNFHTDGTVSVVAQLTSADTGTMRAAIQADPSGSGIVLDQALHSVALDVTSGADDVRVGNVFLVGVTAGAELPLTDPAAPGTAHLPITSGSLDTGVFDAFVLKADGSSRTLSGDTMTVSGWDLERRLTPAELDAALGDDGTTASIGLGLLAPMEVDVPGDAPGAAQAMSVRRDGLLAPPQATLTTFAEGDRMAAVLLPDVPDLRVYGRQDGARVWTTEVDAEAGGTVTAAPDVAVRVEDTIFNVREKEIGFTVIIESDRCDNVMEIDYESHPVSDYVAPWYESDGRCAPLLADAADTTDDTVTDAGVTKTTFYGEDGTLMDDTTSTVAPGATWWFGSAAPSTDPPEEGDTHDSTLDTMQLPAGTPWPTVAAVNAAALDDAYLRVAPGDAPPELTHWTATVLPRRGARTEFTATWTSK